MVNHGTFALQYTNKPEKQNDKNYKKLAARLVKVSFLKIYSFNLSLDKNKWLTNNFMSSIDYVDFDMNHSFKVNLLLIKLTCDLHRLEFGTILSSF